MSKDSRKGTALKLLRSSVLPARLQGGSEDACKIFFPDQLPDKFILQASDILVVMGNKDDILDFIKGK